MKEKHNKCSIDRFLTIVDYISDIWYILYIGSKIYIEKIFSKKYPNNIFDWLQGENRNLQKISWEKI